MKQGQLPALLLLGWGLKSNFLGPSVYNQYTPPPRKLCFLMIQKRVTYKAATGYQYYSLLVGCFKWVGKYVPEVSIKFSCILKM
jgi:hypothetical protein